MNSRISQQISTDSLGDKKATRRQLNQWLNDGLVNGGPRTMLVKFTNVQNNASSTVDVYLDKLPWTPGGVMLVMLNSLNGVDVTTVTVRPYLLPQSDGRWKVSLVGFPSGFNIDYLWKVNLLLVEDSNG